MKRQMFSTVLLSLIMLLGISVSILMFPNVVMNNCIPITISGITYDGIPYTIEGELSFEENLYEGVEKEKIKEVQISNSKSTLIYIWRNYLSFFYKISEIQISSDDEDFRGLVKVNKLFLDGIEYTNSKFMISDIMCLKSEPGKEILITK